MQPQKASLYFSFRSVPFTWTRFGTKSRVTPFDFGCRIGFWGRLVKFLAFFILFLGVQAHAQPVIDQWTRFASCEVNGVHYDVSIHADVDVSTATPTSPISAMIFEAAPSQPIQSVAARIENAQAASLKITLPGYWSRTELDASACTLATRNPSRSLRSLIKLRVSGYVVFEDVPWEQTMIKLPELIKSCDAIPVEFTVICDKNPDVSGPLGCDDVQILEDVIPVETHCK